MSRLTSVKLFRLNLLLVLIALVSIAMPQHSNAQQQQQETTVRRSTRSASAARQSRLRAQRRRAALVRQRAARTQAQNAATSLNTSAALAASTTPAVGAPSTTSAAAVTSNRRSALPASMPLSPSVDPFAEIERAGEVGKSYDIDFRRTKLDTKAAASAKVIQRGQTLLVRMKAEDMPLPSYFAVPRYALWVYVPNYQVKLYIGDLPLTTNSKTTAASPSAAGARAKRRIVRGESDSAYRYTVLPPGAEFGGLMLTAEPIRYTPIVNEALRPVLVGLAPKANLAAATAATAVYAGSMPSNVRRRSPPARRLQRRRRA